MKFTAAVVRAFAIMTATVNGNPITTTPDAVTKALESVASTLTAAPVNKPVIATDVRPAESPEAQNGTPPGGEDCIMTCNWGFYFCQQKPFYCTCSQHGYIECRSSWDECTEHYWCMCNAACKECI